MSAVDLSALALASSSWNDWPDVPADQRPKRLPHAGIIGKDAAALMRQKGWDPIDIRLLPNSTDVERGICLKACLEGVRLKTIEADASLQRFLDLEARALGLTSNREQREDKPKDAIDKDSMQTIFEGMLAGKAPELFQPTKKTGRPPGSQNKGS